MVYVTIFSLLKDEILMYLAWKAQIILLLTKKLIILAKYLDYTNMFLKQSAIELPKQSDINQNAINLELSKQPCYKLIYNLRLVELKTPKTYFKTYLVNSFICFSKSPARALILFIKKLDNSFRLYIDYQGLNNLTIENWYLWFLIGKLLY